MNTKADLEKYIQQMDEDKKQSEKKIKELECRRDQLKKRNSELRGIVAEKEIEVATLRGYVERIIQQERLAIVEKERLTGEPQQRGTCDQGHWHGELVSGPENILQAPSPGIPSGTEEVSGGYGSSRTTRKPWYED